MAVTLEGCCRLSTLREGEPLVKGPLQIWNQIGRATGAQAVSLRVLEFATGRSPLSRNGVCDEILYLLDSGRNVKLFINGCSFDVGGDSGVYVRPGETFGIFNPGPNPVTIISTQCPDPDREAELVERPASSTTVSETRVVRLADQRAVSTADRWYRVLIDDAVGSEQVTQFVGSIPPGRAPDHFHEYEEVLVILRGEGRMWAGETQTPVAAGSCIYLPRRQVHCVENTGAGELRLLGVFYPAGSPSVRYDV